MLTHHAHYSKTLISTSGTQTRTMVKYNISLEGKTVLVTGAAGFIGSNLVMRLLKDYNDIKVVGIDSMTDYYDVVFTPAEG